MSNLRTVPKLSWSAFARRWRLYIVLVLASILPLSLFLYASHKLLRQITIKNLLGQSERAADTAGRTIDDSQNDIRSAVELFATDPVTVDRWMHRDISRLAARLRVAKELKHQVTFWGMYDSKGYLRVGFPQSGFDPNTSFASTDWFSGAMRTRTTQVSSGYQTIDGKSNFFITIATPLACSECGVLTAIYTPQTVKGWLVPMEAGATNWISVVDHNGIVVVAPDRDPSAYLRNVNAHESVTKAIHGKGGAEIVWQDGKWVLATRHPLPSLGWAVIVEIPLEEVDRELWKYERPIGLLGLLCDALALAIAITVTVLYKRLRESQEHVEQILATSQDAFVGIDERGVITEWNPQAEVFFGYSAVEALGRPLHAVIIPPRYREAHVHGLQRFLKMREPVVLNKRLEFTALHRSGHEFPIELSISHVRSSSRSSFNAFIRDISESKRAQQEIASLNSALLREVAQLEARNKELEAFSSSVSHDVRGPLRHILAYSSILSDDYSKDMTSDARECLEKIQNAARRLHQLVDDLLRLSRLGAQELKLYDTDLAALVQEVISELQPESQGRDLKFEVSHLPAVECDSGLMKQVFWNLLANAVKFTSGRERAVIEIGHMREEAATVFFVRDNGAGFDMQFADKLFAPFERLHSQEEFPGTGVGLATVQRIILKHDGRIWAEAEADRGATFFFTLGTPFPKIPAVSDTHSVLS